MRRMVPGSAGADHRMPRRNLRRAGGQRAPSRLLLAAAHIGRKSHFEREHHVDEGLEGDADEQRPDHIDDMAVLERSEEHTSELQSLMRISYAVFCLKKKTNTNTTH